MSGSSVTAYLSVNVQKINDFVSLFNLFLLSSQQLSCKEGASFHQTGYLSLWMGTLKRVCLWLLPNPVRLTVLYLPLAIMQLQLNM